MTDDSLLSPAEACRLSGGLSRSTLDRLAQRGLYPRPIVLARSRTGRAQRIAWSEREVRAWVARTIAASRAAEAALDVEADTERER